MSQPNLDIPIYSPSELVRIELLQYDNPSGLHPIELEWRNLSRKSLEHTQTLQQALEYVLSKCPEYVKREYEDWKPFKFPTKFIAPSQ